jgi:hypothetical protein
MPRAARKTGTLVADSGWARYHRTAIRITAGGPRSPVHADPAAAAKVRPQLPHRKRWRPAPSRPWRVAAGRWHDGQGDMRRRPYQPHPASRTRLGREGDPARPRRAAGTTSSPARRPAAASARSTPAGSDGVASNTIRRALVLLPPDGHVHCRPSSAAERTRHAVRAAKQRDDAAGQAGAGGPLGGCRCPRSPRGPAARSGLPNPPTLRSRQASSGRYTSRGVGHARRAPPPRAHPHACRLRRSPDSRALPCCA